MKVYQINVVCGTGSTGRIAVDLAKKLEMEGDKCRIAYGRGRAPRGVNAYKISNVVDLYIHAFMARLTGKQGAYSRWATYKLIRDMRQFDPDIIHLHNIHGYYVNYKMLFAFLKKIEKPVVWTMHDCWAFTGHCAHYESVSCNKWKKECNNCPNLSAYPATFSGRNIRKNYEEKRKQFTSIENMTIVTPSIWLHDQIKKSFLKKIPCIVINNGVDISKFSPQKVDIVEKVHAEGKRMLLGVAGTWTHNKGFDDFIKLRNLLPSQYIIYMIGVTPKQCKLLPQGIVGVMKTESVEELAMYYSSADFFLNLTYEDTFPTTNIESLACGTPVITYRTGGSTEIVDGTCGMIIERGDLNGIVSIVEEQLREEKQYQEACLERANIFTHTASYNNYMKLYKKLETTIYE